MHFLTICLTLLAALMSPAAGAASANLPAQISAELRLQALQGAVWSVVGPQNQVGATGIHAMRTQRPMRDDDRVHVG